MNRKSVQTLTTALLIGAVAGMAGSLITSTPAYSSAAIRIENKALADAINGCLLYTSDAADE